MEAFLLQSMPQEVSAVMESAKKAGSRTTIIAGEAERVVGDGLIGMVGDGSGEGVVGSQLDDKAVINQSNDKAVVNQSNDKAVVNQSNDKAVVNQSNDKAVVNQSNDKAVVNHSEDKMSTDQTQHNKPAKSPTKHLTHHSSTPSSSGWQVVNSVAKRLTARSIAVIEETLPNDAPSSPTASLWENSLFVTLLLHLDDVLVAIPLHCRSPQSCSSFCC